MKEFSITESSTSVAHHSSQAHTNPTSKGADPKQIQSEDQAKQNKPLLCLLNKEVETHQTRMLNATNRKYP